MVNQLKKTDVIPSLGKPTKEYFVDWKKDCFSKLVRLGWADNNIQIQCAHFWLTEHFVTTFLARNERYFTLVNYCVLLFLDNSEVRKGITLFFLLRRLIFFEWEY